MKTIIIRDLELNDKAQWRNIWQQYLEFYQTKLSDEMISLAFTRLLSQDQNELKCLLATLDGQAVGLAHILTHRHGWFEKKVIYLQDLFVLPNIRKAGVASALINEIYHRADKQNTPHVYWTTAINNEEARSLYDKIGKVSNFIRYTRPT